MGVNSNMDAAPIPEFTARLTTDEKSTSYRCCNISVIVKGLIYCKNSCNDPQMVCTFIGIGGISLPATEPDRSPDREILTPCNSMNQCY